MRLNRLFALLFLAACDGDPSGIGSGDVLLTASVDESAAQTEHNVDLRVENRGDRTLYVADNCAGVITPSYERRVGGSWVEVGYGIPCFDSFYEPVEVQPGAAATGYVAIHEPGVYRMRVRVAASPSTVEYELVYGEFTVE